MSPTDNDPPLRSARLRVLLVALLGLLVMIPGLAGIDGEAAVGLVAGETVRMLVIALPGPIVYLASAWGLGTLIDPLIGAARERSTIRFVCGFALLVSLSHLLGVLGLLTTVGAVASLVPGLLLGVTAIVRARGTDCSGTRALSWWSLAMVPALGVLAIAAASPPGWLWDTEFGGYDALSYHLQLPQEWIRAGVIGPVEHNVYSYLPSYLESAFVHLAQLVPVRDGLSGDAGWRLISMQVFHALLAIIAALLVRRAVVRAASPDKAPSKCVDAIGWLSAALVLATPWTVVVGSLAYNEMGVAALLAGALIVAFEGGIAPGRRALIVGGLVGVACGIKPTALLFAGAPAGIMLLLCAPKQARPRMVALGCLAGLIALAPWLVRNTIASGNPVFPHFSSIFGTSHWTTEQAQRFHDAHFFQGGLLDRLGLLVWPFDLASRGMTHRQWMLFFPSVAIAMGIAAFQLRSSHLNQTRRSVVIALSLGLVAQTLAWLFATHLQSRFLVPMLVPGAILVGVVASGLDQPGAPVRTHHAGTHPWRASGVLGLLAAVMVQTLALGWVYLDQRDGHPTIGVVLGTSTFSGEGLGDQLDTLSPRERVQARENLPPVPWINTVLGGDAPVLLVGGSTPLYLRDPIVYHTTWDSSPIGALMRAHRDDPGAWTRGLRGSGVRFVLINFAELRRLTADGWYDPLVTDNAMLGWVTPTGVNDRTPRPLLVREWPELGMGLYELPRE